MFRKTKNFDAKQEEIIFDCPNCQEQLLVLIPAKRSVIIQCAECGGRCSVKQARTGKKTWDQVKKEGAPKVEVKEIVPELGQKENDIVRAQSLKPGGKAALERARAARESKRVPQMAAPQHPQAQQWGDAAAAAQAPPGPMRRSSSRHSNRQAAAPYRDASTGITPMLSSANMKDGSAFPPLEGVQ